MKISDIEKSSKPSNLVFNDKFYFSSSIIKDVSLQASLQYWVDMECYQLSPGSLVSKVDILDSNEMKLVRESQYSTIQKIGRTPKALCFFSYCNYQDCFRFSELKESTENTVFFLPKNTEYDILVPAGVQTNYIALNQNDFMSSIDILNPKQWESKTKQLTAFESIHKITLKNALDMWFKTANILKNINVVYDESLFNRELLEHILQIIALDSEDYSLSHSEQVCAFQTYRMARRFIREQLELDITPTIVCICREIGVSERSLQYAFRSCVDMTPTTYLRLCRLNQVRSILLLADPKSTTVTDVAMRFGFFHLGRFSFHYKQVFQESPSVTLNK